MRYIITTTYRNGDVEVFEYSDKISAYTELACQTKISKECSEVLAVGYGEFEDDAVVYDHSKPLVTLKNKNN